MRHSCGVVSVRGAWLGQRRWWRLTARSGRGVGGDPVVGGGRRVGVEDRQPGLLHLLRLAEHLSLAAAGLLPLLLPLLRRRRRCRGGADGQSAGQCPAGDGHSPHAPPSAHEPPPIGCAGRWPRFACALRGSAALGLSSVTKGALVRSHGKLHDSNDRRRTHIRHL